MSKAAATATAMAAAFAVKMLGRVLKNALGKAGQSHGEHIRHDALDM